MGQEFEIEIREVLSRIEKIKADSTGEAIDKAIDKAMELYYDQKIVLDAGDFNGDVEFASVKHDKERGR